jgi:polysaccharide pyruvyl transferase WcaK-like protein
MRIGLLTYHHVVNIGSVLQTYCSYNLLTQLFPQAQVEIIDHVPAVSEAFKARQRKVIPRGFLRKERTNHFVNMERAYERFLRERCVFGPSLGVSDDDATVMDHLARAGYDMVFVGSDTVFQLNGYFGEPIADKYPPNAYYLPGLKGPLKFGLAASFDPFTGQDEEWSKLHEVAPLLKAFNTVFYRDATALEVLHKAGLQASQLAHIPDPTILMDITHLVPSQDLTPNRSGRPKAGVAVAHEGIRAKVQELVQQAGYEVLDYMHPPFSAPENAEPSVVVGNSLAGYRKLDLMVTDRFHGSILTLQVSAANVVGIESAVSYVLPNSKLRDLYQRLGIEGQLIRCGPEGPDPLHFQRAIAERPWTRAQMMHRMADLRSKGLASLAMALSVSQGA